MGRFADKWERKAQAMFDTALERAQGVTEEEYAQAVANALDVEADADISAEDIMDAAPVDNWVEEVDNLDADDFDFDWSELAEKWTSNWLRAYGIES